MWKEIIKSNQSVPYHFLALTNDVEGSRGYYLRDVLAHARTTWSNGNQQKKKKKKKKKFLKKNFEILF